MRGLLWISGVLAFLASLAVLEVPAPVPIERIGSAAAGIPEFPADQSDAGQGRQADQGFPLPARSPAVRGGLSLPGLALNPRSTSSLDLASGVALGEHCAARLGTRSTSDAVPVDTLHSKRVRLQI